MKADNVRSIVMERVMRGIGLNRRPGYHFPGNFLDFRGDGRISILEQGPYCTDENGEIDMGYFSLFFDVSMGLAIRKALSHYGRLATLSISATFTGRLRRGPLTARSEFLGLVEGAARPQALVRTAIENAEGMVGYALASFVVVKGQVTVPKDEPREPAALTLKDLDASEADIVSRAKAALDRMAREGGAFPTRFFDAAITKDGGTARSRVENGPHITNRVGHLQGGIQIGLAARNAGATLGDGWILTGANVSYVRPGEGEAFDVVTEVVNKGSTTATLSTQILDSDEKVVLHATTNHSLGAPL